MGDAERLSAKVDRLEAKLERSMELVELIVNVTVGEEATTPTRPQRVAATGDRLYTDGTGTRNPLPPRVPESPCPREELRESLSRGLRPLQEILQEIQERNRPAPVPSATADLTWQQAAGIAGFTVVTPNQLSNLEREITAMAHLTGRIGDRQIRLANANLSEIQRRQFIANIEAINDKLDHFAFESSTDAAVAFGTMLLGLSVAEMQEYGANIIRHEDWYGNVWYRLHHIKSSVSSRAGYNTELRVNPNPPNPNWDFDYSTPVAIALVHTHPPISDNFANLRQFSEPDLRNFEFNGNYNTF